MTSQDNWGDFNFEETQPNSFLSLRNNIKEHICRFLPDRKDLYQACLIHPQWRTAARSVLWESIKFEKPENLRIFLSTINSNNMVALLVKSVQLVFIDHDEDTPFPPIAKSKLERHRPNALSNLAICTSIISVCENITHISIYGFNIGLQNIEQLSAYARNLKSLVIIGAPNRIPVNLNTLSPRLTSLRLDGSFGLTPAWASSFAQKAANLSCLQFSLEGVQAATLDVICASGLQLTELTLTDAFNLSDAYAEQTFRSFPRLRRFRVEGCHKLTSVSIAHSVMHCPELLDLEIRAMSVFGPNNNLNKLLEVLDSVHDGSIFARPTRLVLQNLYIIDEELHHLSRFFTQLKHLGISGCSKLTNSCFQEFVINEDFRFLKSLQVQNCPLIDSNLFGLMIKSREICQSLMRVYLESCGVIDLHDIYQLCASCFQDNLKEIKLVHYEHLVDTVLGSFNEVRNRRMLLLTRQSIDALAHSTDPVLTKAVPKEVTLTGNQIIRLAGYLNMAISELDDLISKATQEEQVSQDYADVGAPRALHDRLMASRAPSRIDQRPSTPTVWSNDVATNGVIVSAPPKNRFTASTLANEAPYQDEDEAEEEEDEEEEDDDDSFGNDNENEASYDDEQGNGDDDESSTQSDKSRSSWNNNVNNDFHPEGNLGGWGAPVNDNWATPSTSTSLSTRVSLREVQEEQQQQQQKYQIQKQQQQQSFTNQNYWTSYTADAYQDDWRQSPLEHGVANQKKNLTSGHYRNAPLVMESDGWGQAKDVIPWNDLAQQGYEKNIIETQRNTDFWNQPNPGEWVVASGPSASKHTANTTTTTTISHRKPKPNTVREKSRKADSSSSDDDHYNYSNASATSTEPASFHGVVPTKFRQRSNSVVSCDNSVDWNNDDNHVTIKVHADFPPLQKSNTVKSPASNWNTAAEWQGKSGRNITAAATTPTIRFSRRATTPRSNNSSNNNNNNNNSSNNSNDQADNLWADYAANSANSPPSAPLRKVAPPPPSPQKAAAHPVAAMPSPAVASAPTVVSTPPAAASTPLLIDTDNAVSSKKSARTGEIWTNLNGLVDSYSQPSKSTLLKPSNTAAYSSVDEIFDMVDTSVDDNIKEFRFGERIAGTVTDGELQREKATMEKDNLVSFDSDSLPDEEQNEHQRDKDGQAKLLENNFSSLDFNATAPVISPLPTKNSMVSPLISNENLSQPQQNQLSQAQQTPAQSQPPQQQKTETIAQLNGSDSSLTTVPPPPKDETLSESSNSKKKVGHKPFKLMFPDIPPLVVHEDDDIPKLCEKHCRENDVMNVVDKMITVAENLRTQKVTRRILGKPKKNKSSGSPAPSNGIF